MQQCGKDHIAVLFGFVVVITFICAQIAFGEHNGIPEMICGCIMYLGYLSFALWFTEKEPVSTLMLLFTVVVSVVMIGTFWMIRVVS